MYDLKIGQTAYIRSISEDSYTCKLLTLGLLPDAKVTYIRRAPFGGARYLQIDNHYVAVRADEAKTIVIDTAIA